MKKLMVIAAAASLAAATEAGIVVNTNCNPVSATCPVVAFKVTASGKIAASVEKKDDIYKTASKLQIKKGALVLLPTQLTGGSDPDCCYDLYSLYLQVKVGKETIPVGIFSEEIDSWSIFGKNYSKALDAEKSKKYKVESEIGLSYINATSAQSGISSGAPNNGSDSVTGSAGLDIDLNLTDFAFIATAFGKGTYAYSQGKTVNACGACQVGSASYEFTPGNYSGWFAGLIEEGDGDAGCLLCNCANLDVFGGTWKAKYNKTWSVRQGFAAAARWVFGSETVKQMRQGDQDEVERDEETGAEVWVIE